VTLKSAVFALQAPNFNSLSGVSLAAAFMSLSYSTIAFAGSINVGRQPGMFAYVMMPFWSAQLEVLIVSCILICL